MKKDYFILFILIFYFFFQLSTLDYGFKINDIEYFKNISLDQKAIKDFTEKEEIKNKENIKNNTESWRYRYKLYSVNADEMIPIMALSKININEKKFDPQIYKYGGGFIYPLGFYYFFLTKTGLIENINSYSITNNENLMNNIYSNGRLFVLLFFIFSALVLYKSLKLITNKNYALVLTTIYLFFPSSIMYSQIIKPNWYALLWFNLSVYFALKYIIKEKKIFYLFLVSIFQGLAIGSSILFFPAFLFVFILIFFNLKKELLKNYFFLLIFSSLFIFFLTNPYILINFISFADESYNEYTWILKDLNLKNTLFFFRNSFIQGFGIVFSLVFFYYILKKSSNKHDKKISIGIFLLILIGAVISSYDTWHIQFRYIPYLLTISLIYLAYKSKNNEKIFIFIAALTILQSIPLKIAYYDENNLNYSTRLSSAKWINNNIIENNRTICKKSFSPFDFPPINFNKIKIEENCAYDIKVLRQPKEINLFKENQIIKKFEPRYQFLDIPLVFSHINPLIIIVEN